MTHLKLSYFDVNGGRGEAIRLACYIGKLPLEDYRFSFSDFPQEREKTPLSQVPILEVDGKVVTQSNAILRYVGKATGLYPTDNYQALVCDEVLDIVEDCTHAIVPTLRLPPEEQKIARQNLVEQTFPRFFGYLDSKLNDQETDFFTDAGLTIAELKLSSLINWLSSGELDYIASDVIAKIAPNLVALNNKVQQHDKVVAYYAQRA